MDSTRQDAANRAWLALLRAPGIGCQTLRPLLEQVPDPAELLRRPPENAPEALRAYLRAPDWEGVDRDLAWLADPDNHLIVFDDPAYPPLLREIPAPPCALYLRGDPDVLALPQLAMVGSRTPTEGGRRTAFAFARHLADAGLAITSGLAEGIDTQAHRGALDANGITLAVTGTGPDRVYPAKNRDLAHRIGESGAIVSEFPIGTQVHPGHFPRRNRIISGLSVGTLVVEAAQRSGSLITARLAGEQGREVYAVPGSIHNPLARGCHRLIREGAKLVETTADILAELAPLLGGLATPTTAAADPAPDSATETMEADHLRLLEAMGYDPVSVDQLARRTGFSAAEVSSVLLLLELQGHVSSGAGGVFTRLGNQPL